jgi:hypothetical protein
MINMKLKRLAGTWQKETKAGLENRKENQAAKRQLLTILVVIYSKTTPLHLQLNNCTFIRGILVKFPSI